MSYQAEIYEILISSPSDVVDECKIVFEEINKWNQNFSKSNRIAFMPVNWQTHSTPEFGERPQEILNKQIVRDSDVLIVIFWTRIGSPTGLTASGTIEEINEFINAQKPVSIYFSKLVQHQDKIDNLQYQKLKEFQCDLYKNRKGLCAEFDSLDSFREMISRLLNKTAEKLKSTENIFKVKDSEIEGTVDYLKVYRDALGKTLDEKIDNKLNNREINGGNF